MHRPRRELGGSRAPSFLVQRLCTTDRPADPAYRIVPQQLETTLDG